MTDREIAIAHMTLWDAETEEDVQMWRKHWDGHIDEMAASEHSGDCTRKPWTCARCKADEAYQMVPVYRALFWVGKP